MKNKYFAVSNEREYGYRTCGHLHVSLAAATRCKNKHGFPTTGYIVDHPEVSSAHVLDGNHSREVSLNEFPDW